MNSTHQTPVSSETLRRRLRRWPFKKTFKDKTTSETGKCEENGRMGKITYELDGKLLEKSIMGR